MTHADTNSLTQSDVDWMSEIYRTAWQDVTRAVACLLDVIHGIPATPPDLRGETLRIIDALEACETDVKRLRHRTDDIDLPRTGRL